VEQISRDNGKLRWASNLGARFLKSQLSNFGYTISKFTLLPRKRQPKIDPQQPIYGVVDRHSQSESRRKKPVTGS